MGRRANAVVDSVSNQPLELAAAPVAGLDIQALSPAEPATECDGLRKPSHVPAFMLGTVFGALAGALLGTLISPHTRAYLVGLYQLASRRLTSAERDKLRFELLLQ